MSPQPSWQPVGWGRTSAEGSVLRHLERKRWEGAYLEAAAPAAIIYLLSPVSAAAPNLCVSCSQECKEVGQSAKVAGASAACTSRAWGPRGPRGTGDRHTARPVGSVEAAVPICDQNIPPGEVAQSWGKLGSVRGDGCWLCCFCRNMARWVDCLLRLKTMRPS